MPPQNSSIVCSSHGTSTRRPDAQHAQRRQLGRRECKLHQFRKEGSDCPGDQGCLSSRPCVLLSADRVRCLACGPTGSSLCTLVNACIADGCPVCVQRCPSQAASRLGRAPCRFPTLLCVRVTGVDVPRTHTRGAACCCWAASSGFRTWHRATSLAHAGTHSGDERLPPPAFTQKL